MGACDIRLFLCMKVFLKIFYNAIGFCFYIYSKPSKWCKCRQVGHILLQVWMSCNPASVGSQVAVNVHWMYPMKWYGVGHHVSRGTKFPYTVVTRSHPHQVLIHGALKFVEIIRRTCRLLSSYWEHVHTAKNRTGQHSTVLVESCFKTFDCEIYIECAGSFFS